MRKINEPSFGIEEILKKLREQEDEKKKTRGIISLDEQSYVKVKKILIKDEKNYKKEYEKLKNFKTDELSSDEKKKISENYFDFNRNATLLNYRYKLYELAERRCPICDTNFGYSQINLDHILPKSVYESLAITPINLVPTCNYYNMKKNKKMGNKIFNPYFHEYNLTKLLTSELEVEDLDFDNILVKICLKKFEKEEELEKLGFSRKQLSEIRENISVYGLLEKYSSIATVFANETFKFYRNIKSLHGNNYIYSTKQASNLLTEQDIWCEAGSNICDEGFIKHISIEAMKNSKIFLSELKKVLSGNFDFEQFVIEQIQEAVKLLKEEEFVHPVNCNALIKQTIKGCDFVAYYKVISNRDG